MSKIEDIAGSRRMLRRAYLFQCPPMEEFAHEHGHEHSRYMTIGRGEYSRKVGRRLITCSFNTLVVEWDYAGFVVEQNYDVEKLRDDLLEISEKGFPFHLLCTHKYNDMPELDIDATLDTARVREVAGEQDTRYFDLTFTEWRDPLVQRKGAQRAKRKGGKQQTIYIELRKDGSYSGINGRGKPLSFRVIAQYAPGYGSPDLARVIAEANNISDWGMDEPLKNHPRYKKSGGRIKVPPRPLASINQPD